MEGVKVMDVDELNTNLGYIFSKMMESSMKGGSSSAPATPAAGSSKKSSSANKSPYPPYIDPNAGDVALGPCGLDLEEREKNVLSVGEEIVKAEEISALLKAKDNPICYDGFEPSGRMHIAQGVQKSINVNKLTKSGCIFVFWVADWFAMLNNKMGGDLKKIQTVGRYMIEIWKALGMDMSRVKFLWASEEINKRSDEYWSLVLDIATKNNLKRIIRCSQIMGRAETDELSAAQIFYPCMQCADIFFLRADICQLGMDQRKVNMLAREYCDIIKRKFKPVILSHHMTMGLKQGQEKMSKSDPESAIYMEDTEQEVKTKVKKAYCPEGVVEGNPCMDYLKHIIIPKLEGFDLVRSDENGGNKHYDNYEELEKDFADKKVHPGDLKPSLAAAINKILDPVRKHLTTNPEAKKLVAEVKKFKTTR